MPLSIDGKEYTIKGIGKIMLFPISKVAQALTDADMPRDTQTIRKWETKGVIPRAIFIKGNKRLFSKKQIDCIVRVAKECEIKKGVSIADTNFIPRIHEELGKINKEYAEKMKNAK